jgi:hypothetical protein
MGLYRSDSEVVYIGYWVEHGRKPWQKVLELYLIKSSSRTKWDSSASCTYRWGLHLLCSCFSICCCMLCMSESAKKSWIFFQVIWQWDSNSWLFCMIDPSNQDDTKPFRGISESSSTEMTKTLLYFVLSYSTLSKSDHFALFDQVTEKMTESSS